MAFPTNPGLLESGAGEHEGSFQMRLLARKPFRNQRPANRSDRKFLESKSRCLRFVSKEHSKSHRMLAI
jgi:hypothetical protein